MRFNKIEKFRIDELLLDEANYRFTKAKNQKACIKKIHDANPQYFKGLMKSIAEDDLGEPLLVFHHNNENIVADGNRRLSVLKVLYDDAFAPSDSVKKYAQELRASNKIDFSKIQAQISDDKKVVSRTVYERHSSGKNGTSRIPWAAYAAARFGFDEKIGDGKEWYIMSLLSATETKYPDITDFLDNSDFSFEVYRRLVRSALKNKVISANIFSEHGERIKKTARVDLINDAISKSHVFLLAMHKREISLSRKDGEEYADKDTVEKYLNTFFLSPDNQELENIKKKSRSHLTQDEHLKSDDRVSEGKNSDANIIKNSYPPSTEFSGNDNANSDEDSKSAKSGICESKNILKNLKLLKSDKLSSLYNSLCIISLKQHPALMYVGAWSFLEVLSKWAGNTNQEFPAFFRNRFQ